MTRDDSAPWPTPEEREVMEASPTRPRVEYVPRHLAARVACDCPRITVDVEPGTHAATLFDPAHTPWALKILHRESGHQRVSAVSAPPRSSRRVEPGHWGHDFIPAYLAKLPPPIPCPECGNVVFMMVPPEWELPGWRLCAGPNGCGRGFHPKGDRISRDRAPASGQPDRERTTRRSERAELIPVEV